MNDTSKQLIEIEKQLLASEEKYAKLFDNLGDEVHLWKIVRDQRGAITTWELVDANPAALKAWNKSKESILGKTADEIFGANTVKQFLPIVTKIFKTSESAKWVEYFKPTNQYLSMSSIPFGDYFISTGEDITAQKEQELALIKSEQKYRNITENLPGIVFRYKLYPDGADELLYVNKGINELFELSTEKVLRDCKFLWDRIHTDDLETFKFSLKESAFTLSLWENEHRIQFPDGRIKWLSMKGVPTKQDDGSVIWDSFGFDITESKKQKEQLEFLNSHLETLVEERTKTLLKTSEELKLYRLAAEHSESGVWYYDLQKHELIWDDIMYHLYSINKDNFSGAVDAWESSLHPDDKDRAIAELNDAIEGKKPFDTVFRIIHPDSGKVSHIRSKGKVERDVNGKAIAVFGTNWDVTREMLLSIEREEALNHLKETHSQLILSEKMASLGVLTAGIAHEINNPLNFILGGHSVLTNYIEDNKTLNKSELRTYLDWIKTGAERASKIVKSLNLLSRSNDSFTEKCNINAIIENCIQVLQHKHKGRILITKDFYSDHSIILGNNGKLHQVILNILSNAIDSIANEGEILVQTKSNDNFIEISIKDTGCGISEDHLKKILDPFFTTKAPGKGSGLGLSIAKSIINEHEGKLNFQSEANKGTTFTIILPKREQDEL